MSNSFEVDLSNIEKLSRDEGPIILVDDDFSQVEIIKACYKKSGRKNELICILKSEDFLSYIEDVKVGREVMPALVLLDINMPKITGFDILKSVRSTDELKEIPIIIVFSTSDFERDIEKSKELKANGFMSKPSHVADYVRFFESV